MIPITQKSPLHPALVPWDESGLFGIVWEGKYLGHELWTVFALAVMEYAVGVSKFGKNPMTLLVHQY